MLSARDGRTALSGGGSIETLLLFTPSTIPLQATSLRPLAPFTVHLTGTPFPSCDALLLPKKGVPPPSVFSGKAHVLQAKSTRQVFPPSSSCSKRSGLERSLRRLFRDRGETELFHLGHHIVVGVGTGDLAFPDLQDKTVPQFARAPPAWKSSRGQIRGSGVVPAPNPLKDGLILCGKHIDQLCPHIREALH